MATDGVGDGVPERMRLVGLALQRHFKVGTSDDEIAKGPAVLEHVAYFRQSRMETLIRASYVSAGIQPSGVTGLAAAILAERVKYLSRTRSVKRRRQKSRTAIA